MENLQLVKLMLEGAMIHEPIHYEIEEVWLDYGARIKHTTIVAYPVKGMSWQIFSPRDLEEIKNGKFDLNRFIKLINQHKNFIE